MPTKQVVLLNPPFYRFVGSHNDRMPLSLCYLSRYLDDAQLSHTVFNADATGATSYWSLKTLFNQYDEFVRAVDDKGPLYGEVVEQILSYNPKTVVIMGADPLVPTKDWGNPSIAANFSRRLREFGVHTVGLGPYFNLLTDQYAKDFDCLMLGEPSPKIVDIVQNQLGGLVKSDPIPLDRFPLLSQLEPVYQKTDPVMSSFGCLYPCEFCVAGKQYRDWKRPVRFVEPEILAKDILGRKEKKIYLEDLNFSNIPLEWLEKQIETFAQYSVESEFTVECRVDGITPERVQLAKAMGVTTFKLGVEGMTQELLKNFNKRQSLEQVYKAFELLRTYKMRIIAYLLIGGHTSERDYFETEQLIRELDPDHVVVSIWGFDLNDDIKYDSQFSPLRLEKWGLSPQVFYRYLNLQNRVNPTVGQILDQL